MATTTPDDRAATTDASTRANRGRLRVIGVVVALIASAMTFSAGPAAADHLGGTPAPARMLPICVTIPVQDGACPAKSDFFTVSASGSFSGSGAVSVTINPSVPACDTWDIPTDTFSPSPCYSRVEVSSSLGCVYLDDNSGDLLSCGNIYRDAPFTLDAAVSLSSTWRRHAIHGDGPWASCAVGSDFRTYFYGGPTATDAANDMRWAWVGPTALDCDMTMESGTPDNLMGASWAIITARIEVKRSGESGRSESHSAQVYQNINGTLSDDAPHPTTEDPGKDDEDPNVPGDDPFEPLGPFTDVPKGSFARADIELMYDREITNGTSGTTYGPSEFVTREQMAAFLARMWRNLAGDCPDGDAPFLDMGGSFAETDVACIYALEVTTGTSGTTFGPDGNVTREQMAAFLSRIWQALGNECPGEPGPVSPFNDVPGSSFALDDILCIWRLGITNGTSGTTYGPSEFVTREQMAAFLARVIRLHEGLPTPGA